MISFYMLAASAIDSYDQIVVALLFFITFINFGKFAYFFSKVLSGQYSNFILLDTPFQTCYSTLL
jgi:hypothetical protein